MSPVDASVLAAVLAAVQERRPGPAPDGWTPNVQGAVGQVLGMRDADGTQLALKIYPGASDTRPAAEVLGLRLAASVLPVPRVMLHGALADRSAGYLLMTRLPGVRWADVRSALDPRSATALTSQAGGLLRRLHSVRGERFGGLLGPRYGTAWERVTALRDALLPAYVRSGGPSLLAGRVAHLVQSRRAAVESCPAPVLCHHDFISGNILLADGPAPTIAGVVDLEGAAWDDPMSDLAQTLVHVAFHAPADVEALLEAYGPSTHLERLRLDLFTVLHRVRERSWVALDRPQGWQGSAARLDALIAAVV
ncbi:phosphotransferase family protein [Cellulomonas sp. URHE0023]|uniref:phosphotransferase family protein n=1 Tax=Cellulomonas sp. URHE0023 TaxID=1380354 RepID=UPI000481FEE6|nr:aminoglycoside phosphotransferase family protein [Cellulomonas sp. URHE0023]